MPTHWECPGCGVANYAEDHRCRGCGKTYRPPHWDDELWSCQKCGMENRNSQNYCEKCGYQPDFNAASGAGSVPQPDRGRGSLADATRELRESLRRQNRDLLGDIKRDLASSMGDVARSLADVATAGSSAEAPVKPSIARPAAPAASFKRVTTRDLRLQMHALPKLNFALLHGGFPLIQSLEISNTSREPAHDVLVRAWVAPDYGEPWQKSLPAIPPGASHTERAIVVPLTKARLQEVREAEQATLRVDVFTEGTLQYSDTFPIEVLAYNEWYYHPAIPETVACFVQPNSPAVEHIVSLVRNRLQRSGRDTDLSGYQSGESRKIAASLEALYGVLQQDLKLTYINPPPSFEKPERLPDGGYTISQKVFFPEQILEHRRGTCLDLALLAASCVERMGLNAQVFIIQGHVFFGASLQDQVFREPVLRDAAALTTLVTDGVWLPLNSTTCAGPATFATCVEEGRKLIAPETFQCAIDVAAARRAGIKPIPPLV